jgi:hypothetical protein
MVRQRSFDAVRLNSSRLKHRKDLELNRQPCLNEDPEVDKKSLSKNQRSSPLGCHKNTSQPFSRSKSMNFNKSIQHGRGKWIPEQRSPTLEVCREVDGTLLRTRRHSLMY